MRRSALTIGLTTLLAIVISSSVFASGVGLTGIGARATALGGAYRGVADDWSAMYWNPAGLTQICGFHAGLSFEMIMPTANFTPAQWSYIAPPLYFGNPDTVETSFSNMRTDGTENEPRTFYIPAFGITYQMSDKLTVGLGFYAPFGLGAEWDLLNTDLYNKNYPQIDYSDDLKIVDLHPTIAYKLSEKISVGVGLSIVYADIIIRTPKYVPNPYLTTKDLAGFRYTLANLGGTNPEYNHLLIDSELAGTGLGFGGNLGLMFNVTDNFKIGLSARYYNDVSIDGRINATAYFADLEAAHNAIQTGLKPVLDGKLAKGEISEKDYGALINYYSGGSSVVYDDVSGDTKLPLPMEVGIGLSYSGIRNLLIAADFNWTQWSAWDMIEIDLETGEKSNLVENWQDGMRYSLGLEYSLGLLKLRGGYYHEGCVVPNETLSPTIPDINSRDAVNLGLYFELGLISLHASYEKILIGDKTVDAWVFNAPENSYDNLAGDYGMKVNNIMFGVGYKF